MSAAAASIATSRAAAFRHGASRLAARRRASRSAAASATPAPDRPHQTSARHPARSRPASSAMLGARSSRDEAATPERIIYKISDDKKFIEIECKGEKGASFDEFVSKMPDGDCRYGVLDVEINLSGATRNKRHLRGLVRTRASVKPKMLYASSKDAWRRRSPACAASPRRPPPPRRRATRCPLYAATKDAIGRHRHQRGVPGDRPRRPRPRRIEARPAPSKRLR